MTTRCENWSAATSTIRQRAACLRKPFGRCAVFRRRIAKDNRRKSRLPRTGRRRARRLNTIAKLLRQKPLGIRPLREIDASLTPTLASSTTRRAGLRLCWPAQSAAAFPRAVHGNDTVMRGVVAPGIYGTLAGIGAANVPLAYNALGTEPDNPHKRGYEAYGRELPPSHPRRQEWIDYAAGLPEENPVRTAAAKEFYDWDKFKERAIMGGGEGFLGAELGANVGKIVNATGSVAGKLLRGRGGPPPTGATPGGGGAGTPSGSTPSMPPTAPPVTTADILQKTIEAQPRLADRVRELREMLATAPSANQSRLPSASSSSQSSVIRSRGKDGVIRYHDEAGNFTSNPRKKTD